MKEVKRPTGSWAAKYHPDYNINNPNKDKAEEMFKLVQQAYEQITYERQHLTYSSSSSAGSSYGETPTAEAPTSYQSGYGNADAYRDFEDFFNQAFGGAYFVCRGPRPATTRIPSVSERGQLYQYRGHYAESHQHYWKASIRGTVSVYYYSAVANSRVLGHNVTAGETLARAGSQLGA